jgi:hypothetical protein
MNRLQPNLRASLEIVFDYSDEELEILKFYDIGEAFTTPTGISKQIDMLDSKPGIIFYACIDNGTVNISRLAVNLEGDEND